MARLLGLLHAGAAVAVAAGFDGPVRLVVVLPWMLIVPGWSLVTHVRADAATRVALTLSVSFALALLVSSALVYFDEYRFSTAFWLLFALITPGVVLALFRSWRRRKAEAAESERPQLYLVPDPGD